MRRLCEVGIEPGFAAGVFGRSIRFIQFSHGIMIWAKTNLLSVAQLSLRTQTIEREKRTFLFRTAVLFVP
jgi:hypothetical protein